MKIRIMLAAFFLMLGAWAARADDREAYNRRAADGDMAAFRQLDLNRDGTITPEEMRRYVERTYGVKPAA